MFLLLDNYDSFTWNIYHYMSSFDVKVDVIRNDKINSKKVILNNYNGIIFSPGPGRPENAGNMMIAGDLPTVIAVFFSPIEVHKTKKA